MKYLLASENTKRILDTLSIETGRKAMLGDPARYPNASHYIQGLHVDVASHVRVLQRIDSDGTKTTAQKHLLAERVSQFMLQRFADTQANLRTIGARLRNEASDEAEQFFNVRQTVALADTRSMLREINKEPGGKATTLEILRDSVEVAAVVYMAPHPLMVGLKNAAALMDLKIEAMERHTPQLHAKNLEGAELQIRADKLQEPGDVFKFVYDVNITDAARKAEVTLPAPLSAA